jgi:DNA-binding transcriptional ArsR family regulator
MTRNLQSADPLNALGDASRRAILDCLADGPRSVGDIASKLPISRPAVSRHLRLLETARLVSVTRVGTRRLYELDSAGAQAVKAYLDELWASAATRFQLAARNVRPRGQR